MNSPEIIGYEVGPKQGSGTFGTVHRSIWGGQLECALKILELPAIHVQYVSWCAQKLRSAPPHPNVAAVYGFDLARQPSYVSSAWLGQENGQVVALESVCGTWSVRDCLTSLRCIADGLTWLHRENIIHTGLTTLNVLLTGPLPENVVITDVGQGCVDDQQIANWIRHAPYLSPERLRMEQPHGETSGEAWDVYSFGVLAFRLLTGKFPRAAGYFKASRKEADFAALAAQLGKEPFLTWPTKTTNAGELGLRRVIERCLALRIEDRFCQMVEVSEALLDIEVGGAGIPTFSVNPAPSQPGAAAIDISSIPTKTHVLAPALLDAAVASLGGPAAETPAQPAQHQPEPLFSSNRSQASSKSSALSENGWRWGAMGAAAAAVAGIVMAVVQGNAKSELQRAAADWKAKAQAAEQEATKQAQAAADSNAKAADSAKRQALERKNLQGTQEHADRLLEALLELRPQETAGQEQWSEALNRAASQAEEFLAVAGKEADLRESAARARWHLAEIRLRLGDTEAASELLEEAAREVDAAAAATTQNVGAEWSVLLAKIQMRRAELGLRRNLAAEALQHTADAVKGFEAWLTAHPEDDAAQRGLAKTHFIAAQAAAAKGDTAKARESAGFAKDVIERLTSAPHPNVDDVLLLVDADFEAIKAASATADDKLLEEFRTHLERLVQFDSEHPKLTAAREKLVRGYFEMGLFLSRLAAKEPNGGNLRGYQEATSETFKKSIDLLLELTKENPAKEEYTFQLGRSYGEVARLVRSVQGPHDALKFAKNAVDFLGTLVQINKVDTNYRLHYGFELVNLSEILEDTGDSGNAIKSSEFALEQLEELTGDGAEQALALSCLARAYRTIGVCSEKLNKKDAAIASYTKAIDAWQKILNGGSVDEHTKQSLAWTQQQLKRLRP